MLTLQGFGGTVHWEQLPVYVVAEVLAGVAAAAVYTVDRHARGRLARSTVVTADATSLIRCWPSRPPERQDRTGGLHTMKKLINDPGTVVADALKGIEAAHPELRVDHEHKVIYRADRARCRARSGLVSGGGSGHEPLHGGFVGVGMLDAACAGEVFTSPTPDQMSRPRRSSTAAPASSTSSRTTPATS